MLLEPVRLLEGEGAALDDGNPERAPELLHRSASTAVLQGGGGRRRAALLMDAPLRMLFSRAVACRRSDCLLDVFRSVRLVPADDSTVFDAVLTKVPANRHTVPRNIAEA